MNEDRILTNIENLTKLVSELTRSIIALQMRIEMLEKKGEGEGQ